MADPITLSAGAIAVLIATKSVEKIGEKITESTWKSVGTFLSSLRQKDPQSADEIEKIAQSPLIEGHESKIKNLVIKIEKIAENDECIRRSIQELNDSLKMNQETIINLTKVAEKVGVVIQGGSADFRGAVFNF